MAGLVPFASVTKTVRHIVTDWPAYFPNAPEAVRVLVGAGANPSARTSGDRPEAPLHWAASSNDVRVAAEPIARLGERAVPAEVH